jgi:hypothetical protein
LATDAEFAGTRLSASAPSAMSPGSPHRSCRTSGISTHDVAGRGKVPPRIRGSIGDVAALTTQRQHTEPTASCWVLSEVHLRGLDLPTSGSASGCSRSRRPTPWRRPRSQRSATVFPTSRSTMDDQPTVVLSSVVHPSTAWIPPRRWRRTRSTRTSTPTTIVPCRCRSGPVTAEARLALGPELRLGEWWPGWRRVVDVRAGPGDEVILREMLADRCRGVRLASEHPVWPGAGSTRSDPVDIHQAEHGRERDRVLPLTFTGDERQRPAPLIRGEMILLVNPPPGNDPTLPGTAVLPAQPADSRHSTLPPVRRSAGPATSS